MASIKITDNASLTMDLQILNNCPLARAGLTQLVTTAGDLFGEFNKPLDLAVVQSGGLGGNFNSPNFLGGDVDTLTVGAGINCGLSIKRAADKLLFNDDGFSPVIPIDANEAWLGLEFDLAATGSGTASAYGFGICLTADAKLTCSTFSRFSAPAPPLPSLKDACTTALNNFSLTTRAANIRTQLPETVNVTEMSGSVKMTVSLNQPFTLNPLASATLPFNTSASIQPAITLHLGSSVRVAGDFLVRCYKVSDRSVRIGIYKKHGSTLAVEFTAAAGIQGDLQNDDVLGAILNRALPAVDVTAAGLGGETAATLNGVIRDGLNRSLSAQFNATCSAAFTHEAALLYDIQLDGADAEATDSALDLALQGDWTLIEALPNAHRIRNIAVETIDKKRSLTVNLLGFYSATSTTDYLRSSTVLIDESGQITITDKIDASRISASTSPYATDGNKLRQALMEDFLCTATYVAMSGKLNLNLSVVQTYRSYESKMSRAEMGENVLLGYSLGLIPHGSFDDILQSTPSFYHAFVCASVQYDRPSLLAVFYKDPASRTQRSRIELEQAGRQTMSALLDPSDPTNALRLGILKSDNAWAQMDAIGNVAAFHTIPELSQLGTTQLAVVSADWISIVWWAEALSKIAPALTSAIDALNEAPAAKPTEDAQFMKARAKLAQVLGAVTRNTSAAFVHGWGAAVMFALSGMHGSAQMDLTWNSKDHHFGSPR